MGRFSFYSKPQGFGHLGALLADIRIFHAK